MPVAWMATPLMMPLNIFIARGDIGVPGTEARTGMQGLENQDRSKEDIKYY